MKNKRKSFYEEQKELMNKHFTENMLRLFESQAEDAELEHLKEFKEAYNQGVKDERKRIVDMIEIRDATTLNQEPAKAVLHYILKEIEQI